MMFLKAQRQDSYPLYIDALKGIHVDPCMFDTGHYKYARWITVHISDLENLTVKCPGVDREFHKALFVTKKAKPIICAST